MNYKIKLFDEINKQNINYVIWKNINLLDKFFNGKENLDIYVESFFKKKLQSILKKNNCLKVNSTIINHNHIDHYLYFFEDKILHIHAYFRLFTGSSISKNYDLTNYYNFFDNKFFDKKYGLWIMDYNLQMILFKIRLAIKKDTFLGRYMIRRDIVNLKEEYEFLVSNWNLNKINNLKKNIINANIDFKNLSLSYSENQNILKEVALFRTKSFFRTKIDEIIFLYRIILKKIFKFKKFKLKNKVIIFISGPDASGKSTISLKLKNIFNNYIETKIYNIAKPYPIILINFLIKNKYFINKKKNYTINKDNKVNKISIRKVIRDLNLSFLRFIYSIIIFRFSFFKNIIILDRYVSENINDINGPRINYKNKKYLKFFSFLELFFYKNIKTLEIEYQLNTSLDNCLLRNNLRKKNIIKTSDEVSDRFLQFKKSKFKVNKTIFIDNNKDIKISVNEIMKNIFIYYHENY